MMGSETFLHRPGRQCRDARDHAGKTRYHRDPGLRRAEPTRRRRSESSGQRFRAGIRLRPRLSVVLRGTGGRTVTSAEFETQKSKGEAGIVGRVKTEGTE